MPLNLNKIYHVAINVTDLDRSISFYQKLGFRVTARFTMEGELETRTASAFNMPYNVIKAAFLKLGDCPVLIDLCEFTDPPTEGRVSKNYNNVGMGRIAFHVDDIEATYAEVVALGFQPLGPLEYTTPPGGGKCGVFAFHDPDGTIVEVLSGVEQMAV